MRIPPSFEHANHYYGGDYDDEADENDQDYDARVKRAFVNRLVLCQLTCNGDYLTPISLPFSFTFIAIFVTVTTLFSFLLS